MSDNNYYKNVSDHEFEMIITGRKIAEATIFKGCYTKIAPTDNFTFFNYNKGKISARVTNVKYYENYEKMLIDELPNVLPDIFSIDDGLKHYRTNIAEENRLGVVLFYFEII